LLAGRLPLFLYHLAPALMALQDTHVVKISMVKGTDYKRKLEVQSPDFFHPRWLKINKVPAVRIAGLTDGVKL